MKRWFKQSGKTPYIILGYFVLLSPFCFLGYGTDNDTYRVLDSARSTWLFHTASTSRNPGYWVYEAIAFVLMTLGGYVASNLATLSIGAILVWRFLEIAARLQVRYLGMLLACLVVTPVFTIASTSTMDYLWSLLPLALMVEAVISDRILIAIVTAALSFSVRGSSCIIIIGILTAAMAVEINRSRKIDAKVVQFFAVGLAALLLGCFPYIESYRLAGHTFQFLQPMGMTDPNSWTLKLRIGRFVYKGLYLFGPLAWVFIILYAVCFREEGKHDWMIDPESFEYRKSAIPVLWGAVFSSGIVFLIWPLEISYLIPGAFFLLLILGTDLLARRPWMTFVLFASIASADMVTFQIATPNITNQATGARVDMLITSGQLIKDVEIRRSLLSCNSMDCWLRIRGNP